MSNSRKSIRSKVKRALFRLLQSLPTSLRHNILRRLLNLDYSPSSKIQVKLAETRDEFEQAFNIIYQSYHELGLTIEQQEKLRLTKHHALPTTSVIIAKWEGEVIGTVSHILDSGFGLPIEQHWNVSGFREQGELLAEISSFAIAKRFRKNHNILFYLTRFMLDYAMKHVGVDRWVIVTHPKIKDLYMGILCFETIDKKVKSLSSVHGAAGLAQSLNLNSLEKKFSNVYSRKPRHRDIHNFYFKADFNDTFLFPNNKYYKSFTRAWTTDELDYFLNQKTSMNKELSQNEQAVLSNTYYIEDYQKALDAKVDRLSSDRRETPNRYSVNCPAKISTNNFDIPLTGKIIDVSKSGMCLISIHPLEKGELTEISASIGKNTKISLKAKVVWASNDKRYGFEVLNSTENDWTTFLSYLANEFGQKSNRRKTA